MGWRWRSSACEVQAGLKARLYDPESYIDPESHVRIVEADLQVRLPT